jgi:hypothetical protein
MNIKSQFLDQPKFQDKHEYKIFFFFFFFKSQKLGPSVCKCVPHTPKLKSHIVPNVCISWKDLTREMEKLSEVGLTQSIPPKLEFKHTCSWKTKH